MGFSTFVGVVSMWRARIIHMNGIGRSFLSTDAWLDNISTRCGGLTALYA